MAVCLRALQSCRKEDKLSGVKKLKPAIALLLSLLTIGLGQLYNGQVRKAFVLYFGAVSAVILGFVVLASTFAGLAFTLGLVVGLVLIAATDAVLTATRLKQTTLKDYHRWYIYLAIALLAAFLVAPSLESLVLRIGPFRVYRITTSSMLPTLRQGDRVMVDSRGFRAALPKRRDISVVPLPNDRSTLFIKRVIGLPGDTIEIRNKVLFVNGQEQEEDYVEHTDPQILPAGAKQTRDNFPPLVVPPNQLFVLGDNRDATYDSRFFGTVPVEDLKGKPLYIYWSSDRTRIGRKLK